MWHFLLLLMAVGGQMAPIDIDYFAGSGKSDLPVTVVSILEMGCLPTLARVQRATGEIITMDALKIGDAIMIDNVNASQIFHLTQNETDSLSANHYFLKMFTADGDLHLSNNHYLYVNGVVDVAAAVNVGDNLTLQNGTTTAVVLIEEVRLAGIYSPHTLDGNLVVDGFRIITHSSFLDKSKRSFIPPVRTALKFLMTKRAVSKTVL